MTQVDLTKLKEDLIRDEGLVLHAYKDTKGYLTIGVGRLIDKARNGGISKKEALFLLDNDILGTITELDKKLPWFKGLSEVRQRALVNMAFNLGINGLMNFKKMLRAMEIGHFDRAALEARDSKWYFQVGDRAKRIVKMIQEG